MIWENAMKLPRRQFLHLAAGAAALSAIPRTARAQAFPSRSVRIVVPFPPGQATDAVARLIGQSLSERMGQAFVIENRPGAGGNIATETVVRAQPDGHTLLLVGQATAIFAAFLYKNLNYDFIRDIVPVANLGGGSYVMTLNPSVPARTVPEFIAYAKANPDKINMGSSGTGSASHVFGELFKMMTGVNLVHIPYRGGYVPDLLSGQVQIVFASVPSSLEHIRSGQLRALAVTGATRSEELPDIPTIGEVVSGYNARVWYGIGAPRNTPADVIESLNKAINATLADTTVTARLAKLGVDPMPMSAPEFGQYIVSETEKWAKVIKFAGIKPE
jgi:tripartite-type tricarboxylate transporter receptor subunit TctC